MGCPCICTYRLLSINCDIVTLVFRLVVLTRGERQALLWRSVFASRKALVVHTSYLHFSISSSTFPWVVSVLRSVWNRSHVGNSCLRDTESISLLGQVSPVPGPARYLPQTGL